MRIALDDRHMALLISLLNYCKLSTEGNGKLASDMLEAFTETSGITEEQTLEISSGVSFQFTESDGMVIDLEKVNVEVPLKAFQDSSRDTEPTLEEVIAEQKASMTHLQKLTYERLLKLFNLKP